MSGWFLQLGGWGLDLMMAVIRFWSGTPKAALWTVTPNIYEILLYYGLLACLVHMGQRSWIRAVFAGLVVMVGVDAGYWVYTTRYNPHLRITYLDVGQGNAALIQLI